MKRVLAFAQFLLPRYLLTALVHRIARWRWRPLKNLLIRNFVRLYRVELDDVDGAVPDDFPSLNAFFTRPLADAARPVDDAASAVVSPVDGTLSQAGTLRGDRLLQAKNIDYTLDDLLATDLGRRDVFSDGAFATIYLAPYDYHRVHAPFDGELKNAHYVPGDLLSVNAATAGSIGNLFCRNERLNLEFATSAGPALVIFVGALNVGSITTPWTGEIRPRQRGVVDDVPLGDHERRVRRGELLGWFNMGSTVIILLPRGDSGYVDSITGAAAVGARLRMGERIGTLATA